VRQLWAEFADLDEFEHNVVEPGEGGPDQAADAVARLLAAGELTL
jgi:hypothetical protein